MKDKFDRVIQQARTASRHGASDANEAIPPGLATRIAARWSTGDDRELNAMLFERVTACCLLPALAAWAILVWSTPPQAGPNLMELLYSAQLIVEEAPPF